MLLFVSLLVCEGIGRNTFYAHGQRFYNPIKSLTEAFNTYNNIYLLES